VLKQGRKVFEGPLQSARTHAGWVRLKVDDFQEACRRLRAAALIIEQASEGRILPAPAVESDRIVRFLVEQGFRVFEIAPETEMLEEFYLSLMHPNGATR